MKKFLNLDTIYSEEKQFEKELAQQFAKHAKSDRGLELTEAAVAEFLAIQIVLPILTGLLSSWLYDKFKDIKTKTQAEELRKELRDIQIPEKPPVEKEVVLKEMTEKLTMSLEKQEASVLVTKCYERIERKISAFKTN
jgi:hypothetical protein